MIRTHRRLQAALAFSAACAALPPAVHAQPADLPVPAATTDQYPSGVKVIQTSAGRVYADARGQVLYGMDMRTLIRWGADPATYCRDECARDWEPLLAPPGVEPNVRFPRGYGDRDQATDTFHSPQKAPDWTVIAGAQGPQWVYKGWHVVFTRRGSARGATAFDGAENLTWNTLKFVPPMPLVTAPSGVTAAFVDGAYALTDTTGRLLFTGSCKADCAEWEPFTGGMASRAHGKWTISRTGDRPQWLHRGKPVFVSHADEPASIPPGGKALRP